MSRFTIAAHHESLAAAGFLSVAFVLAALQFHLFGALTPTSDGTTYLELADQIQRVGYAKALSLHWSPLYPLFVLMLRGVTGASIEGELALTAFGDALLLFTMCAAVVVAFRSIAHLCWPDSPATRSAWLSYTAGAAVFLAFAILRVGLRMPDVLVTILAVTTLVLWCHACARGLAWRWCAAAGVTSGLAYLARTNLLHWSVAVAVVACLIAPLASPRARARAFGVFVLGLLIVVGPQTYVHSSERGYLAVGESGRMALGIAWGATWPGGASAGAWPVRVGGGDVRLFPEPRVLNFPGFYEPGREFDDASLDMRWWKPLWGALRAANSCLMGNWTASFALLWPAAWAIWPAFVFAPASWHAMTSRRRLYAADPRRGFRLRIAWLLMLAGAGGVAMHALSFCNGYYMPPYFLALFSGLTLDILNDADAATARERRRAIRVVGIGFAVLASVLTARYFRAAEVRSRQASVTAMRQLAAALEPLPAGPEGLKRIAASGDWLGLYAVRLSGGQIFADLPDPEVLHDVDRLARALRVLGSHEVSALIVARSRLLPGDRLQWQPIPGTDWAIVDLRMATAPGPSP